jgi:hypothetical protein
MNIDRRVAKADRRVSPRVPLVCAVRNQLGQRIQLCLSSNISREGMEVWRVRDEPLGQGNAVKLEFELPGCETLIAAPGIVVFDREDLRTGVAGVRFEVLPPEHEKVIEDFVSRSEPPEEVAPRAPRRSGDRR